MPSGGGRTLSNVLRSQPAKIEMFPVAALWQPPETGQSAASPPLAMNALPSRMTSASSVVDISAQIFPGHASDRRPSSPSRTAADASRRRQAGDDHAAIPHHAARRRPRPCAPGHEFFLACGGEVPHRHVPTVANEASRELSAHVAKPDESDLHANRRLQRCRSDEGCAPDARQSSIRRTLMKASCGMSTLPNRRIFFFPAFCFSRSFLFRVTSPP